MGTSRTYGLSELTKKYVEAAVMKTEVLPYGADFQWLGH